MGWKTSRLDEIAEVAIGPFGSSLKRDSYQTSGLPIVSGGELQGMRWPTLDGVPHVDEATAQRLSRSVAQKGDLLFPHRGAIGRVAIAPGPVMLSTSMMRARFDPTVIDPEFAFWFFTAEGNRELLTRASSVGTPGIGQPLASLRSIWVRYPELPAQQAIAEVLGALDDKIAANRQVSYEINDLLGALFLKVTDGCSYSKLGSIADVNRLSVKPRPRGELRYLDIASVGVGDYEIPETTDWSEAPGRARRGVQAGDTVWSTVRPNRRSHCVVLDEDPLLVASTGLVVLSPRECGPAFLFEASRQKRFQEYLESVAEGSAYPAVRAAAFEQAPVAKVDDTRLAEFESVALPLRAKQSKFRQENRVLAATRDALLPLLMSGKITVIDAEKRVEQEV